MSASIDRRTFLQGLGLLLALGSAGCADAESTVKAPSREDEVDSAPKDDTNEPTEQEESPMQISVTVNGTSFTATIEDTNAGRELLSRLPLTLSMDELHGNEKYCYTGKGFGGEQYVPETIEAGDLMVFGSDCLVLFYETFSNGGWSYARVGRIDDPMGLADACSGGTATVAFEPLS